MDLLKTTYFTQIKSELNIGSLAHFLFPLIHFKCKRNTCSKEHGRCNTAQYWENNSGFISCENWIYLGLTFYNWIYWKQLIPHTYWQIHKQEME